MAVKSKTTKPDMQRKRLVQSPYHRRGRVLSANLSPELRESYNRRSVPVRTGDTVRIARGDHTGYEGKITRVDRKKYRIFVDGIKREKADGTTILIPIHASKVKVINLNLDDKWRKGVLKTEGATEEAKPVEEKVSDEQEEKPQEIPSEEASTKSGGK